MLENVAGAYERDVEDGGNPDDFTARPIMILMMAVGVGFIIFSILVPIMDMGQMVQ